MKLNRQYLRCWTDEECYCCNTITQAKKHFSTIFNKKFNAVDKFKVQIIDEKENPVNILTYYRFNRIFPNNTIIRGNWS